VSEFNHFFKQSNFLFKKLSFVNSFKDLYEENITFLAK